MNFWQKTKRFLEPAMEKQWLYIWLSGISVTFAIGSSYLQIYMIQVFTQLFASDKLSSFSYEAKIILSLITFSILAAFFMRAYSWIYPQFGMSADLTRKYLTKYIVIDNHAVENIGTGRMIAIFRGVESWSVLLNE